MGFHFQQITLMSGQRGRQIIKLLLVVGRECGRSAMESDRNRVLLRILVQSVDRAIQLVDFACRLSGYGTCLLCLRSSRSRYLVGLVGSVLRLVDASLSASIDVL